MKCGCLGYDCSGLFDVVVVVFNEFGYDVMFVFVFVVCFGFFKVVFYYYFFLKEEIFEIVLSEVFDGFEGVFVCM